jgi:hemolysin III
LPEGHFLSVMNAEGEQKNAHHEVHPTSGYTVAEEVWNSLTHGLGLLLALAGLVLAVFVASTGSSLFALGAAVVYGLSLVALYLASFMYHSSRDLRWKRFFLKWDHACIYLLIAGSYTPFTLGPLRGPLGWSLFGVIWALAFVGVFRELRVAKRGGFVGAMLYLAMGWLCILVAKPLFENLSTSAFALLFAGGVVYSLGIIFYLAKGLKYHHAIWHLFVLGGSVCQYLAILTVLR